MTSMLAMKTCRCRVNPMPSSPQIENPEWSATRKVSRIQSAWNCLKDVEVAWYRNHAVQSEVGTVEQITIFLHRTNLATGQDEHCNIRKFPGGMNIPSGNAKSTINRMPSSEIAFRQFARMVWAFSSSQSTITCFINYARQPEGTWLKKSQSTIVLRAFSSPLRNPRARESTCGWCASTPRNPRCASRIAARRLPLPPPSSMRLPQRPKSQADAIADGE